MKASLQLCNDLTKRVTKLQANNSNHDQSSQESLIQLRQLVWFLKIKCLAEDYFVNESLLFNEDDIESEDHVRILSGARMTRNNTTLRNHNGTIKTSGVSGRATAGTTSNRRPMTGILTGRFTGVSSRQSSRGSTSYRPLTTSLTSTQTAFSRSTRPLLKYSTQSLLAKCSYEYLYNAQTITNKCPDYRQCLEYLNLVQNSQKVNTTIHDAYETHDDFVNGSRESTMGTLNGQESDEVDSYHGLSSFWLSSFGICYYNLRMNKQAEKYFLRVIRLNPKYLDPYSWLIKIYLRVNEPIKVLKICSNGLTHNKNPLLFNWLARAQSLMGDLYGAHVSLRESLSYFPTNIEALANAGYFAFYGDRQEQALKCYQRISGMPQHQPTGGIISPQLLNNIALCNLYCGFYHRIVPLFLRALLESPNKDVTSDIWYNMSFVPIHCGFINLAIKCLRLSLMNNSQNEEAMNNLGVLEYGHMFDRSLEFPHFQSNGNIGTRYSSEARSGCKNKNDLDHWTEECDKAESYFSSSRAVKISCQIDDDKTRLDEAYECSLITSKPPESLFNMAIIKKTRGHLIAATKYCDLYTQQDPNNYQIRSMMKEIRQLVMHDT